ncbi:jg1743 [Pararge aegeria aegeria]|uniref:Jg1743 protein n=1 Tax=Pararge aegeria aegeria TaxID=348720 RepID=A0A8S4SQB1_9NEOP|nr:jg1743 [Pararge aegeria aegeria]
MGGTHSSEKRPVSRCWRSDPTQVNTALVDPKLGGETTSDESLGAAESRNPETFDFGTRYKRRPCVEVTMLMMN